MTTDIESLHEALQKTPENWNAIRQILDALPALLDELERKTKALLEARDLLETVKQTRNNIWYVDADDPETAVCDTHSAIDDALSHTDSKEPPMTNTAQDLRSALEQKAAQIWADTFVAHPYQKGDTWVPQKRALAAIQLALAAPATDEPVAPDTIGNGGGAAGQEAPIVEWIVELARRDIMRDQTDFIGRMHQAIGDFEFACEHWADGEVEEASRDDAGEALAGLAGLALAQLAMVSSPSDPLSQFAHSPAAEPVGLRDAVIAAMTDDPYWNDAAGTTDHDARLQHYADVIVAKLQGKEAS